MSAKERLRPRLLPVVLCALIGLLALKSLGLVTQGAYILPPGFGDHTGFARALTGVRSTIGPDGDLTGATPAKKDQSKPDAKNAEDPAKPDASKQADAPAQPLPAPHSTAERQILESLSERRRRLEQQAQELDMREQLLKSAEQKIEERLGALRDQESRGEAADSTKDAKAASPFKSLVTIYESMKPREAAKVFERMDARQLAMLASQMNPRKLSEILAQMSPDSAEKLTAALLRKQTSPEQGKDAPPQAAQRPASPALPELEELPRR